MVLVWILFENVVIYRDFEARGRASLVFYEVFVILHLFWQLRGLPLFAKTLNPAPFCLFSDDSRGAEILYFTVFLRLPMAKTSLF